MLRTLASTDGFLLWMLAVALAITGQLLFTLQQIWPGRVLFIVSAIVGYVAWRRIDHFASVAIREPDDAPAQPAASGIGRATGVVFITSATVSLLVVPRLVEAGHFDVSIGVWLFALVATLVGATVFSGAPPRFALPALSRARRLELGGVLAILAITLLLRLPAIESAPPDVHGDEAFFGIAARLITAGERPNYFSRGDNYFSDVINSGAMRIFGDDLRGLRLGSAIAGTISVLALYLFVRRLFGMRPALIASWLLAVAQWHIHYSRNGITCMHALTATVLLLSLLVRALSTRRTVDYVLVGFAAGLCLHVYYPARIAPVLAVLYVFHRAFSEPGFVTRQRAGLVPAVAGLVVFLGPFGVAPALISWQLLVLAGAGVGLSELLRRPAMSGFVVRQRNALVATGVAGIVLLTVFGIAQGANPANVAQRAGNVFVLREGNLRHQSGVYKVNSVEQVLFFQTVRTLEAFNLSGESSQQYFRRGVPLFDFWTASLLAIGIVAVTARIRQSRYFLVASWIWLTLIVGSILTVDAPFSPRIIVVLPALMILPALVLDVGWRGAVARWGARGATVFSVGIVVYLLLALGANYRDYFEVHITQYQPAGFSTVLSREIQQINGDYRVLLISGQGASLTYETPRFLVPNVDGETVGDRPLQLPLRDIPVRKGVAFMIQTGTPLHDERLHQLKIAYHRGEESVTLSTRGVPLYTTYRVEREDLIAAAARASAARIMQPGLF